MRAPALLCHTGQDQLVPEQMDWVHDLRDDHLDAPVKHMNLKLGIAEIVDPVRLKGFTKANCPSFPKGNARNFPQEVDVQDTDAKYLPILKRIGCHSQGIPERELPPSPFRKEASILRTETFGSHSLFGSPKEIDTFIIEGASQVPVEAVAETYFQLAGKNLTRR